VGGDGESRATYIYISDWGNPREKTIVGVQEFSQASDEEANNRTFCRTW
jgi:hypothetical protein